LRTSLGTKSASAAPLPIFELAGQIHSVYRDRQRLYSEGAEARDSPNAQALADWDDGSCPVALKTWLAVADQEIQCGREEQALSIITRVFSQFE
jgi:hypothetical protein